MTKGTSQRLHAPGSVVFLRHLGWFLEAITATHSKFVGEGACCPPAGKAAEAPPMPEPIAHPGIGEPITLAPAEQLQRIAWPGAPIVVVTANRPTLRALAGELVYRLPRPSCHRGRHGCPILNAACPACGRAGSREAALINKINHQRAGCRLIF